MDELTAAEISLVKEFVNTNSEEIEEIIDINASETVQENITLTGKMLPIVTKLMNEALNSKDNSDANEAWKEVINKLTKLIHSLITLKNLRENAGKQANSPDNDEEVPDNDEEVPNNKPKPPNNEPVPDNQSDVQNGGVNILPGGRKSRKRRSRKVSNKGGKKSSKRRSRKVSKKGGKKSRKSRHLKVSKKGGKKSRKSRHLKVSKKGGKKSRKSRHLKVSKKGGKKSKKRRSRKH